MPRAECAYFYVRDRSNGGVQDKGAALKGKSILEVVQSATEAPVRNNGGGHYNHSYVS